MTDENTEDLGALDAETARRIDTVCRQFEADWKAGHRPSIDQYVEDFPQDCLDRLRAALLALARDMDDRNACSISPSETTVPIVQPAAAQPGTITATRTDAPRAPLSPGEPGQTSESIHESVTVAPFPKATMTVSPGLPEYMPTTAHGEVGQARPGESEPLRVRYFGDYEIVREIARGGMGVVFEARQVSLNRPVALKMILAGQLADETDIRRFHTEAEAAANLDHPGIVPIYEVGRHNGQHYFSMGFIEGQSLSQRLAGGPLPAREAAELVRRVADAIQYAHERGVIHRDLKPANILLDQSGNPRVTDFGLAKKVQSDSGLTGSGQIMGTPSYMPPEQAGGKRGEVGPPADVYALGATLYCLLSGRPPFQAASVMDTVLQVIGDEPVAPRRLNPSVPRDLETVCLKCLEKDPARRYPTAAAFGEDLRRFLAGEPISARPVSRAERAWRWSRRNPLPAALIMLVVVLTTAGTATITALWLRSEAERRAAVAAGVRAERARAEAIAASERAEKSRQEAVAAGKRAEANAATARRAVNDYLDRITTSPQLQRPGLSGLRRELLTRALSYYESFLRESAGNPELRVDAANAQNRAAMLLLELGETAKAVEAGKRAVALSEQLASDQPDQLAHRHLLASALNALGNALRTTRQSDEALAMYRRSGAIREALVVAEPDNLVGATDLAIARSNLAKTLGNVGRVQESEELLKRIRTELETLIRRVPNAPNARDELADTLHSLGNIAADRGQFDEAKSLYLQSLELREAIVRDHPDNWGALTHLARINNELGILHFHFKHPDEALRYYDKSRELRERLLAAEPASAELQEYLARSLENLGNLYNSLGKHATALPLLERCRDLRAHLAAASSNNAEMQGALGGSLHNLAMSHEGLGHDAEAERLYKQAIDVQNRARSIQPEIVVFRVFLTNHLHSLSGVYLRTGKVDEAAKLATEAAGLWTKEPQPLLQSAVLLTMCVKAAASEGSPEKNARKERLGRAAVELLEKAVNGGFRNLEFFRSSNQLDPIRDRADFKSLVERLESGSARSQ
jgi:tetratricopeptide (TPR) repeat protein